jgi:hypothetical protein
MANARPFKSSKHPELENINRMCQVNINLTHPVSGRHSSLHHAPEVPTSAYVTNDLK